MKDLVIRAGGGSIASKVLNQRGTSLSKLAKIHSFSTSLKICGIDQSVMNVHARNRPAAAAESQTFQRFPWQADELCCSDIISTIFKINHPNAIHLITACPALHTSRMTYENEISDHDITLKSWS